MAKNASVYLQAGTEKEILARGTNKSAIINRDLDRLYSIYRECLLDVKLTPNEALLVCEALAAWEGDSNAAKMLYSFIYDTIRNESLRDKWDVDGRQLVDKLRNLPLSHCLAIIDAAGRFFETAPTRENHLDIIKQIFFI